MKISSTSPKYSISRYALSADLCLVCVLSNFPRQLEPMQEDDDTPAKAVLDANELLPIEFQVPPPSVLGEEERVATVKSAATRIWQSSGDLAVGPQTGGRDV